MIISVSGLRGVVGDSLTPANLTQYVSAFCGCAPPGAIVVGRDGRGTGGWIAQLVQATLQACGREAISAGIAATPTVGRLVCQYRAAGGVQVTASHNPPEYNGLKLFGSDGRVLSATLGEQVHSQFDRGAMSWVTYERTGHSRMLADVISDHLQAVLKIVDVPRIRSRRFRVLLDSNAGAGSILGLALLEALGCDVTAVGAEPTGQFLHPPEPTRENLVDIGNKVVEAGAVVGFCQDPDADRLALIDASGEYVGEEYTLSVCADHILKTRPGRMVTNCSSSRMTEDLCRRYNVPFARAKVGEANVADLMLATEAVFGGEGNGGPIEPRVGYVRDSFVGMALVLDAMSAHSATLSQLVDAIPRYCMVKTKVQLDLALVSTAYDALQRHFAEAVPDMLDGLRLDWHDRWLMVRPSNTEPIVRIIVEAATSSAADQLAGEAMQVLRGLQE
jgi:phosphomannomutase